MLFLFINQEISDSFRWKIAATDVSERDMMMTSTENKKKNENL